MGIAVSVANANFATMTTVHGLGHGRLATAISSSNNVCNMSATRLAPDNVLQGRQCSSEWQSRDLLRL